MAGLLQTLDLQTTRYDPVDAELTFTLPLDQPLEGAELRGRLNGPRCAYTETIEIAFPLKPVPGEAGLLRSRVVIPEASSWDPSTPFLYEGAVELWHAGQVLERTNVSHGLRHLLMKKASLILNGQRFRLKGQAIDALTADTAKPTREAGINLLLANATMDNADVWAQADRLGFFVLGQVDGGDDELLWRIESVHAHHTSCFGWVLPQHLTRHPQLWHNAMSLLHGQRRRHLIGVQVEELPLGVLPGHVSFIVCERRQLEELGELPIPRIVLLRRASQAEDLKEMPGAQFLLGWVAQGLE
jgi:hypothetical protein